jgi:segregation and condensation protein B
MSEDAANTEDEANTENGSWPIDRLEPVLEALLFAAGDPIATAKLAEIVEGSTTGEIRKGLKHLSDNYRSRGLRLVEVAGGWQMRTGPEHHRYVRKLFRERPFRVTRAATETMAIVAYKQPCTRTDVEAVRGVECGQVMETLVERRLLKILGRKDAPGRPLLYGTAPEFLELFGLKSLRDLPTLGELGDDVLSLADQGDFVEGSTIDPARILPLDSPETDDGSEQLSLESVTGDAAPDVTPEPSDGDEKTSEA